MKQWIFFDLGSTLIDERETYKLFQERCVRELHAAGCCVTAEAFEEQMLRFAKENKDPVNDTWAYFAKSGIARPKWDHSTDVLFPDVPAVLGKLAQLYHLGIIANQGKYLEERLENFGVLPYFEVVVGSADVGLSKPDVAIFDYALTQAGVLPEEAIYVGDRMDNDMVPAKKLGMATIWMQQGLGKYNQENLDFPCDDRIKKVSDLLKIL